MKKHSGSIYDTISLRDRVAEDLKETFRSELLEPSADEFTPDLTIKGPGATLLVEIKVGNSGLPLPSSANSQMLILKRKASELPDSGKVVPVLVTNYMIDPADKTELARNGIQLIMIPGSAYDSRALREQLESILVPA